MKISVIVSHKLFLNLWHTIKIWMSEIEIKKKFEENKFLKKKLNKIITNVYIIETKKKK